MSRVDQKAACTTGWRGLEEPSIVLFCSGFCIQNVMFCEDAFHLLGLYGPEIPRGINLCSMIFN